MAKIGRNDPCPCGSGKKYKHCHLSADQAIQQQQLRQRRAVDTLIPKIVAATQQMPSAVHEGFKRYWDGKYSQEQMAEIDDFEDRGADRFMTWFIFDYMLDDGLTLVEHLAVEPSFELEEAEAELLPQWKDVRLWPYVVEEIAKGQHLLLSNMVDGRRYILHDSAASRRLLLGEVLVAHLVPAGDQYYIGGAAAHLTADTRERLREYAELHMQAFQRDENPQAGWGDLIHDRSEVLNHFVMQLPVEQVDPTMLDTILLQTRASLQMAGESLGLMNAPQPEEKPSHSDNP